MELGILVRPSQELITFAYPGKQIQSLCPSQHFKTHVNILLPPTAVFRKWCVCISSPLQNPLRLSLCCPSLSATCHHPSHSP